MERFVLGQDGIGALQPGLTRTAGTQFSMFVPGTPASVLAVAVVFEGGNAVGEDGSIGEIFAARRADAADLNRWLEAASKLDPSNGMQFFGALSTLTPAAEHDLPRMVDEFRQRLSKNPDPELPSKFLEYLRARCAAANRNSRRVK